MERRKKMKAFELLDGVELQNEVKFVRYDYEHEVRVEITEDQAAYRDIRYIYSENDVLFIEVDSEE